MKIRRYTPGILIRSMSNEQIAYLAALIDGEGSICITKGRNKNTGNRMGFCYRPVVHVASTHRQVLHTMKRWTGLGHAACFDDARVNRKARYQWMIWSNQAAQLVACVLPFLIIKRRQARLLLKFVQLNKTMKCRGALGLTDAQWKSRHSIYRQMKVLNA